MSAKDASQDQRLLLEKINQYSEPNRRTDKLATCMKQFGNRWDNSHVAFTGLQLRALGWVTTFKDASQYAQWNITPVGKAALMELNNLGRQAKQAQIAAQERDSLPVKKAVPPPQYAVYCVSDSAYQGDLTLAAAEKLANEWAKESDGEPVFIVSVIKTLKAKFVVEEA